MRILIAEDNEIIQLLHRQLMSSWGYDFDMASNGLEAVALAKENNGKYDLGLMDVEMPDMNGIDAVKLIRKATRYFPIVAYTANENYRTACHEAGMDDFVQKPCFPDELLAKIREWTIKSYRLIENKFASYIDEIMPMDKQQADELRELAKKNLRKLVLFDSPSCALIVHKNVINKISHDFNIKGQLLTTFINRNEDQPTLCHLFKESNNLLPQILLTEEEYAAMTSHENGELNNYTELALKSKAE